MSKKPKVRTCPWFDGNGEDAAEFEASLLPNSSIETVSWPKPAEPAVIDHTA